MRCLIVGDVHWSTYSSILMSRNDECSTRLSLLLDSVNWAENLSREENCDIVVYLGDFFDRANLNQEECTILQKVVWNADARHIFLVGNHESSFADLRYSSTKILEKNGFTIIDKPMTISGLTFIPYLSDANQIDLHDVVKDILHPHPIVFSHNDIKGIQYGAYTSKSGFDIEDIRSLGGLFVNGHLHNQEKFFDDGRMYALNLGNLTGQNFNEDAFRYPHQVMTLDTETREYAFHDNPKAIGFYKIDENHHDDLDRIGDNAVVWVRCEENEKEGIVEKLKKLNVLAYRTTIVQNVASNQDKPVDAHIDASLDHLNRFREFVMERIGTSDVVLEELEEVCK